MTKQELIDLATRHGFPDPNLAAAVAMAESGGDPAIVADTRSLSDAEIHTRFNVPAAIRVSKELSVGLWQINTLAHPTYDAASLKDPDYNANAAFVISNRGTNWGPWRGYTSGAYRKYL
jgi:hypothetical protein